MCAKIACTIGVLSANETTDVQVTFSNTVKAHSSIQVIDEVNGLTDDA